MKKATLFGEIFLWALWAFKGRQGPFPRDGVCHPFATQFTQGQDTSAAEMRIAMHLIAVKEFGLKGAWIRGHLNHYFTDKDGITWDPIFNLYNKWDDPFSGFNVKYCDLVAKYHKDLHALGCGSGTSIFDMNHVIDDQGKPQGPYAKKFGFPAAYSGKIRPVQVEAMRRYVRLAEQDLQPYRRNAYYELTNEDKKWGGVFYPTQSWVDSALVELKKMTRGRIGLWWNLKTSHKIDFNVVHSDLSAGGPRRWVCNESKTDGHWGGEGTIASYVRDHVRADKAHAVMCDSFWEFCYDAWTNGRKGDFAPHQLEAYRLTH